ncbi:hypothetical protein PHMEG_00013611, partial [Phytophthora megakarya]
TIVSQLASGRWYHRRFQNADIPRVPQLRIILQGIRRMSNPVTKKYSVTPSFLRVLRHSITIANPRHRLLWGSLLLAYFFLYCLKDAHVYFTDKNGSPVSSEEATAVTIGLEGAKNDQYGRGAWRTMHASGDWSLCPVRALRHIRLARTQLGCAHCEHLCMNLSSEEVTMRLKQVAIKVGVPPSRYATHSLRIGGATSLWNARVDSLAIKLLGRWVSRCYEEYPVQAAAATAGLSGRMI